MIFYKNGWHLCSEKVKYIQHGKEVEQYVTAEGHDWWTDFEEKWEHTEIIEFIPVEPTEAQINRFEEVIQLNIKEGHSAELSNYIETGEFPKGNNHVLRQIQIEVENQELGQELSEREINEIIQGQQLSDMEIQLLELQLGGM